MTEQHLTEEDLVKKYRKELGYNPFEKADIRQKRDKAKKDKEKRRAKNKAARKARRTR